MDFAFKEDNEILIESFLDGTEVSVGVIEWQNKIKVMPETEIVSHNEFFDFEAKYLENRKRSPRQEFQRFSGVT